MRWLVDVYMQSEVAVTYKVRDGIPLVPTEQLACHVEGDDIAKRERKNAMARQAVKGNAPSRSSDATYLGGGGGGLGVPVVS